MNEPRVVESVTNECQSLGRAHESSPARAEQLIACLEGEIAKRDARIAGLEAELVEARKCAEIMQQSAFAYQAELSAIKAQEPAFMWHKGATEDESEVVDVDCACPCCVPLYAAPVSEAKAQGVVMPERDAVIRKAVGMCNRIPGSTTWNAAEFAYDELADRINATPVQQVSVPDGWLELLCAIEQFFEGAGVSPGPDIELRMATMLAAAPAAPAADAGDVLEQAMYTLISIGYHENSGLVHELRQALAARRVQVVL